MQAYTSEQKCLRPHKDYKRQSPKLYFGSNFCPVEVAQRPKASVHMCMRTPRSGAIKHQKLNRRMVAHRACLGLRIYGGG